VTTLRSHLASVEPSPVVGLGLTVVIVDIIDLVVLTGRRDGGDGTR
jgi:hypothetical protein